MERSNSQTIREDLFLNILRSNHTRGTVTAYIFRMVQIDRVAVAVKL